MRTKTTAAVLCVVTTLLGCGGGGEATPPAPQTGQGTGAGNAPPGQTPPSTPPPTTAPTGVSSVVTRAPIAATGTPATDPAALGLAGTVHGPEITLTETWDLAGSPHRFPNGANIKNGVTVTVEPGTLVVFPAGQWLHVEDGAQLVAVGTADKPIKFDSDSTDPVRGVWYGLNFASGARPSSRLEYVTIEEAGGQDSDLSGAIYAEGSFVLDVRHVTIRLAKRNGVALAGESRFAPTSTALTVTESGIAEQYSAAVRFESANAVGSLPEGAYTGNATDEICVHYADVTATATWRNPGVRYRLLSGINVGSPTGAVLTVAPGATLAFAEEQELRVGAGGDGAIVMDGGSEEGRITLTSARPVPDTGDWGGVFFGEAVSRAATKLSYVTLSYTGHTAGSDGAGCSEALPAAILISTRDLGPRLDHLRFTNLATNSYAIARDFSAEGTAIPTNYADVQFANDFATYGGKCRQTIPYAADGACAEPRPSCD